MSYMSNERGKSALAMSIWLFMLGVYPLLFNPFKLGSSETASGLSSAKVSVIISSASRPSPEMVWILPREILLFLFAALSLLYIMDNYKTSRVVWLAIAYSLLAAASGALSGDSADLTLLGSAGRGDGLLYAMAITLLLIFSYLLGLRFNKRTGDLLGKVIVYSAAIESLVVLLQRLGIDVIGSVTRGEPYPVITGTIGNPGMAAAFLLPAVIIAVYFCSRNAHAGKKGYLLTAAMVVISVALGLTVNRSSILAMLVALPVLIAVGAGDRKKTYLNAALSVLLVLTAPIIVPNGSSGRNILSAHSLKTRLLIWRLAADITLHTKGQPLLGGGFDALREGIIRQDRRKQYLDVYRQGLRLPPGQSYAGSKWIPEDAPPDRNSALLVKVHDSTTNKTSYSVIAIELDKAHNLFLDRALTTGILSSLIWLWLYLAGIAGGLATRRSDMAVLYSVVLLALLVYYLFWFPVPQVEPVHVAILGVALALAEKSRPDKGENGVVISPQG